VRLRLLVILGSAVLALVAGAPASGYPWPVRPFDQQHPIRGNFGDPRMIFAEGFGTGGATGPGSFIFHNGIDVVAPDGTPVYPVLSGTVRLLNTQAVVETTDRDRTFQYWHIVPVIHDGQHVIARRTVLGYIRRGVGHVHLTEIRGSLVWNPLAADGIAPYRDTTDPVVRAVYIRRADTLKILDPAAVCGRVQIVADAYDTHALAVPGPFAGYAVAPAVVTWSLSRANHTRRLAAASGRVDFRTTLPRRNDFWSIYARGTYQNSPRFGPRQYAMAGLFLYQLTRHGLETRDLPNGIYRVTVRASDIQGNTGSLTQSFTVANDPSSPTGCRTVSGP